MTAVLTFVGAFVAVAAAAPENWCRSDQGRARLKVEYIGRGGPVPACGASCLERFLLDQVCDGEQIRATCYTDVGRRLMPDELCPPAG